MRAPFLLLLAACLAVAALGQAKVTPRFSQYRVPVERPNAKGINFKRNRDARTFRTRLNHAFAGGVNFAGHYIVAGWGCGTGCTNAAVIEARTGDVFWPDEFMNVDATYGDGYSEKQIDFRKDSRMLVIHGRPGSRDENAPVAPSGDHYFEWKNNRFRLIKVVPKQ